MGTWNTVIVMVWTMALHILHRSSVQSEIKKIGPMIAKKLWEDRAMRAKGIAAVKTVDAELKKAANE